MALLYIPVVILSLAVHEFAHAWLADSLGDPTPSQYGRVTLNPLAHLDPIGTLVIIFSILNPGMGIIPGWGKPVPVNPNYMRNSRWGDILVSAGGPISNLLLAALFAVGLHLVRGSLDSAAAIFTIFIVVNISLALFNLIPIPPLDGSHVLKQLLPLQAHYSLVDFERRNPFLFPILLIVLLNIGAFNLILGPPFQFLLSLAGVL